MTATIYLEGSEKNILVEDFSSVKFSSSGISHAVTPNDLEKFSIYKDVVYIFFGKTTVAVSGSEILYVEFK